MSIKHIKTVVFTAISASIMFFPAIGENILFRNINVVNTTDRTLVIVFNGKGTASLPAHQNKQLKIPKKMVVTVNNIALKEPSNPEETTNCSTPFAMPYLIASEDATFSITEKASSHTCYVEVI